MGDLALQCSFIIIVRTLCNQVTEGTHNAVLDDNVLIRILTSGQVSCLQSSDGSLQVPQALVGVLAELRTEEGLVLLVPILGLRVATPDEATIHHSHTHTSQKSPHTSVVNHGLYSLALH